jgi:osomolarity two-component system response regulator SSK1
MINMKLLEQFVRRLKVNWDVAINGKEAVEKWRKGGFHLVLMDIQLPIMSGVDATKEIRRLERINQIGVLHKKNEWNEDTYETPVVTEDDRLPDISELFKSPVIIVALTASNLQSDRNEALAAGCNDFLTKVCLLIH